jgi:hypothetical protein
MRLALTLAAVEVKIGQGVETDAVEGAVTNLKKAFAGFFNAGSAGAFEQKLTDRKYRAASKPYVSVRLHPEIKQKI